mmetsp:Transcript_6134/g.18516  ORF Transcript_6134/g.18516 Transcript_6134/m.18516 type:complete len:721 (+) Transcript_6134:93-2255(+)
MARNEVSTPVTVSSRESVWVPGGRKESSVRLVVPLEKESPRGWRREESKDASESARRRYASTRTLTNVSADDIKAGRIAARRAGQISPYVIDPMNSAFIPRWDGLIAVSVLYTAVVTPAEVGFMGSGSDWLFIANQAVNAIFIVDMVLQFFTAYQLPNQDWVRDHRKIVIHYISTTFAVDLIASFPYDLLVEILGKSSPTALKEVSAARLFRLVRLLKLLRLVRSSKLIKKYRANMSLSYGFLNVAFFMFISILTAHWIACAWGVVGNTAKHLENSWLNQFAGKDEDDKKRFEWAISAPKNQYLVSLYMSVMTLTTVGYGNVNPVSLSEYALLVVCMLVGGFLWAYIIGAVCGTIANLDRIKIRHQQRYDQINNLLVNMCIPYSLARDVRAYCFQHEEVERHDSYVTLVDYLSPMLQRRICAELVKVSIALVHYMANRSDDFKMSLYKRLKTRLFCPKERITEQELLVIVNNGCIQAYHKTWVLCLRGDALNLDFLLKYQRRPPIRMQSQKYTEVNVLARRDLEVVCAAFPRDRAILLWMRAFYAFRNEFRRVGHQLRDRLLSGENASGENDAPESPPAVEDLHEAVECAQDGDLERCSARFRDSRLFVERAIDVDPAAFRFASPRLRGDVLLVDFALRRAGPNRYRELILPHVAAPLHALLALVGDFASPDPPSGPRAKIVSRDFALNSNGYARTMSSLDSGEGPPRRSRSGTKALRLW